MLVSRTLSSYIQTALLVAIVLLAWTYTLLAGLHLSRRHLPSES